MKTQGIFAEVHFKKRDVEKIGAKLRAKSKRMALISAPFFATMENSSSISELGTDPRAVTDFHAGHRALFG